MSLFDNYPKRSFTLSDTQELESFDIFNTIILDDKLKTDPRFSRSFTVNEINRIENLKGTRYTSPDYFWLIPYTNSFSSFSDLPQNQSLQETNLNIEYNGKVYYIQNAKLITDIQEDDMIVLYTTNGTAPTDWNFAGLVKEYDSTFRRIVLKREYENDSPSAETTNNTIYIYRKQTDSTYVEIAGSSSEYTLGRKENEIDKIQKIYASERKTETLSPFKHVTQNTYDFSDSPDSNSIIYRLCNDINDGVLVALGLRYETTLNFELEKGASARQLTLLSDDVARTINSFVSTLGKSKFELGKIIGLK
tara:strand:- start:947 stop:1864 length:918 start_codon:yes stop_codon:yes gene_type:complete